MNIKRKIFALIVYLKLAVFELLLLINHVTTGDVFGIVCAAISIVCWLGAAIIDIIDIKRYYKE